jgi:regulatory protein
VPQSLLDDALARCHALLARREYTAAQLRARLERAGIDEDIAAEAVAVLVADRYVDDAGYAQRFAEDRRNLQGWGAERIRRRLQEAGVSESLVESAVAGQEPGAELEAARELLRRRGLDAPADDRERQRAFAMLVRRGYGSDLAYAAVRAGRDG